MCRYAWFGFVFGMGCAEPMEVDPFTDAVYFVEMVEQATPETCKLDLTYNFEGAQPAGEGDVLFEEDSETNSPSGGYAYVTRRGSSELVLNLEGDVFVGEYRDDTNLDVAWESASNATERTEVQDDYLLQSAEIRSRLEQLTLTRETETLTGTMTVTRTQDLDYSETDEWDPAKTGISQSGIPAFQYLEPDEGFGFVRNQASEVDCVEGACQLIVSETCSFEIMVTAWPVEGGIAAFEALADFDRAAGVQGPF